MEFFWKHKEKNTKKWRGRGRNTGCEGLNLPRSKNYFYFKYNFYLIFSARNEPSKVVNRETSERAEKRKKKKSYYAKLKREEDDKMAELAAKYRDR